MKHPVLALGFALISSVAFAGPKVTFIKGKPSVFSSNASFLVELDMASAGIDGLDTEAAFIEFKKNKKEKGSETWEADWARDKESFLKTYTEHLSKGAGSTGLKFTQDDAGSKYRMVLRPVRVHTGNPAKHSSVEMKAHVYDMATNEEVAIVHISPVAGAQLGPMTPTVGMRVNLAMMGSARVLAKHIKKLNK